jgi:hypothetical protein
MTRYDDIDYEYPSTHEQFGEDYLKSEWQDCLDDFLKTFDGGVIGGMTFPYGSKVTLTVDHLRDKSNFYTPKVVASLFVGSLGFVTMDFEELEAAMLADEDFVAWCYESEIGKSRFDEYCYIASMDWNDVD